MWIVIPKLYRLLLLQPLCDDQLYSPPSQFRRTPLTFLPAHVFRRQDLNTSLFQLSHFASLESLRNYFPTGVRVMWAWESPHHDWKGQLIPCIAVWAQLTIQFQTPSWLSVMNKPKGYLNLRQQLTPNCLSLFQWTPFWHCIFFYAFQHKNKQDGQTMSKLDKQREDKRGVRL